MAIRAMYPDLPSYYVKHIFYSALRKGSLQ